MRVNAVFCGMLFFGVAFAAATGRMDAAQRALLGGGAQAVELCLSLAGAYAFFGGVLGVLREAGVCDALARRLRGPLSRLMRFSPGEEAALTDVSVNLAANLLGMGGAATPAGVAAMRKMAGATGGRASEAMLLFFVVNTTSVQLLPASMIALRAQAGAASPADIVPATLISTAVSTLMGALACRAFEARARRRR